MNLPRPPDAKTLDALMALQREAQRQVDEATGICLSHLGSSGKCPRCGAYGGFNCYECLPRMEPT